MFDKGKINSHLFLFKDDSTKGKYGIASSRNYIETLNGRIDCDYCVLQYTEHGRYRNERGYLVDLYPIISKVITKVVSFTPARLETGFLSKPKFIPPQLIVQDQGGTQFNLLEAHRCNKDIFEKGLKQLDDPDGNATIITPVDRAFKLVIANRLPSPYIDPKLLEQKCEIFFMTKENAADRLEHWKTNKNERMNQMKLIYDARQAAKKELRDRQARNQRKVNDLDNLFKK